MAEYIDRNKIIKKIQRMPRTINPDLVQYSLVKGIISRIETADVAPIVRCKECNHFNLQTHECENEMLSTDHEGGASYSLNFYDDDFCSYGERSTDISTEN